jgi:hypothetical protein
MMLIIQGSVFARIGCQCRAHYTLRTLSEDDRINFVILLEGMLHPT